MDRRPVSRRSLLGTAVALPVAALVVPRPAAAQLFGQPAQPAGATMFRAVAVDVQPLLDHGGGNSARALAEVLLGKMRQVFGDRLSPGAKGAPLLTARITNLYLNFFSGQSADFAFGNNDNIEGDGIVTLGGRVLSTTHILTELPPSYSGAYYTQNIDQIRVDSIAYQFAYWLRREMNI